MVIGETSSGIIRVSTIEHETGIEGFEESIR